MKEEEGMWRRGELEVKEEKAKGREKRIWK